MMGGHEAGILATGPDLQAALALLIRVVESAK